MSTFHWQIAFALELVVVVLAFGLWFKAARAEGGPKGLARIVAIVIIVLSALLMVCTLTKAITYASGSGGAGAMGPPCEHRCWSQHKAGAGPGIGMGTGMGMGRGMMDGSGPCRETAASAETAPPATK